MNRKRSTAAAALLVLAGVALAGVTLIPAGGGTAQAAPVAMNRASTTCAKAGYDAGFYRRQVDPIVSNGITPSAHMHDFYGPLPIGPGFSAHNIQAAGTPGRTGADPGYGPFTSNCPLYGDWPLYWFPTAKLNGADTLSGTLTSTLQAPAGVKVITPPFGESVVTGNAMATLPQPRVRFTCGDGAAYPGTSIDGAGSPTPHDCTSIPGGVVTGEITFPDCWDGQGVTKDTAGLLTFDAIYGIGINHFSYSVNGQCAAGSIPCVPGQLMAQLVTQQTWMDNRATIAGAANPDFNKPLRNPLNADGSMALSFSSGPYYTYHGDYINTWNMDYLTVIVTQCLNNGTPGSCPPGTPIGLHTLG